MEREDDYRVDEKTKKKINEVFEYVRGVILEKIGMISQVNCSWWSWPR